jgi:phosphopantothenoylcysteine decarboxylase / phosphopantothenate---cysteine ligase
MTAKKTVILGVTGSIAAYKAADIVRRLMEREFDVSVVMTKAAQQFVTPVTFAALSGKKVTVDMFEEQDYIAHIELAQKADLLLIAPATASIIAKLANGFADDVLTCTALATRAKMMIAPAMNTNMYTHVAVDENCAKLKKRGVMFVEPIEGKLACGISGKGHLADVEEIVKRVCEVLK